MFDKLFKRDHIITGVLLGILLPALFFLALYLLDMLVFSLWESHMVEKQSYLVLLSLTINLIAIKYYFVNLNFDKTGRGILLITFVFALAFFAVY